MIYRYYKALNDILDEHLYDGRGTGAAALMVLSSIGLVIAYIWASILLYGWFGLWAWLWTVGTVGWAAFSFVSYVFRGPKCHRARQASHERRAEHIRSAG
jgi:hypothetical protein